MSAPLKQKTMTVDEFIPWAMARPRGRYELINGEVVMMSPERAAHWRAKASVHMALALAVKCAGLSCEAVPDGATVSLPSVRHYLIIDPEERFIVHHERGADGRIVSTSWTEGTLVLDPPGIEVSVTEMLPLD